MGITDQIVPYSAALGYPALRYLPVRFFVEAWFHRTFTENLYSRA
jgi:hypothetical protein